MLWLQEDVVAQWFPRLESEREKDWVRAHKKDRFLAGPIVSEANMGHCDMLLKYLGDLDEREIEVKKEIVCEGL